eukprot:TRINITY_DN1257_c1_g1_i1.p1 TRINITY_DN1257_c1_g1~~TRINITY_DN1257_c1_g1_i1.p1  ORF type:complete len:454 (+),score=123.61 TRINITY_DN1257_c1_g1_i1:80-1441(+)
MVRLITLSAVLAFATPNEAVKIVAESEDMTHLSFDEWMQRHGRSYSNSTGEYHMRKEVFETAKKAAILHNSRSDRLWNQALNKYADRTDEELAAKLGWRPIATSDKGVAFAQEAESSFGPDDKKDKKEKKALPESVDWSHLKVAQRIPDQGRCGSCWAVAATQVLNAHHEIRTGQQKYYSAQEMLECTPNPRNCGGNGGCRGATVELGYSWVMKNGLSEEKDVPYKATDEFCGVRPRPTSLLQESSSLRGALSSGMRLSGFEVLPKNKEEPLRRAVTSGPVAVSAAAGGWFRYHSGIFNSCNNVINHAVTLYGYGTDNGQPYWLVRNSWGSDWGEKGFVRIVRHFQEDEYCGIDKEPEKGVDCPGGPKEVTVCGNCGILYDSVVPIYNQGDKEIIPTRITQDGAVAEKEEALPASDDKNFPVSPPKKDAKKDEKKPLPKADDKDFPVSPTKKQ